MSVKTERKQRRNHRVVNKRVSCGSTDTQSLDTQVMDLVYSALDNLYALRAYLRTVEDPNTIKKRMRFNTAYRAIWQAVYGDMRVSIKVGIKSESKSQFPHRNLGMRIVDNPNMVASYPDEYRLACNVENSLYDAQSLLHQYSEYDDRNARLYAGIRKANYEMFQALYGARG